MVKNGENTWLKLAAFLIQQQFKFGNGLLYGILIAYITYIQENIALLQCFPYIQLYKTLPAFIQCFPYSKNNTFLSIHFFFFCILPRLQCMFFLYIGNNAFPSISLIQGKQYLYTGIRDTIQIMVFSLYMIISPFFSYISCHSISLQVFLYISIKDTPFFFCILPRFFIQCVLPIYIAIRHSFLCFTLYISIGYFLIYRINTYFFFILPRNVYFLYIAFPIGIFYI